jgi:hypothetical protein
MSDLNVWNARRETKANTIDALKEIKLQTDEAGQYQHDEAIKFKDQLIQVATEMANPEDNTKSGMRKLFEQASNELNSIKTKDIFSWRDIIKQEKDKADAKTKNSTIGKVYQPDIATRGEAQEEADRLNQFNQAVIGIKEGFKDCICNNGGTDALASVLKQADGTLKSIDDYTLFELIEARIAGAKRPQAKNVLKQIVDAITMPYNFQKKIMDNVAMQQILVNKAQSFGITIDVSLLVVNLEANMEFAQSHEWGREFRVCGQVVRKKYPDYTHKHNQTSFDDIVKEYATADRVRDLTEAPTPTTEQANQVGALTAQLQAIQRIYDDVEESAFAADDTSSRKSTKKKKKQKESTRGRSVSSSYRGRSQSRDSRVKNKCKHCKSERKYAAKHDPDKCFYNKKYKGWRPSAICEILGIPFKRRSQFSSDMGGFANSAEEDSDSESESESEVDGSDNE